MKRNKEFGLFTKPSIISLHKKITLTTENMEITGEKNYNNFFFFTSSVFKIGLSDTEPSGKTFTCNIHTEFQK